MYGCVWCISQFVFCVCVCCVCACACTGACIVCACVLCVYVYVCVCMRACTVCVYVCVCVYLCAVCVLLHCLPHQYPVLTLGDDLGSHTIVHRGTSPISGLYVVEEFTGEEGAQVRRLVFLRNPLLAQTEVQMKRESMFMILNY